jgi:pyruvate dehydrogenase E2 component (dihydrolipoyllysine-residue acetyltransferase)
MMEFRMPSLGADMEAGTLVQWLKQPGDALSKGDIIAVVDTDKGAIDIEVFHDGILDRALVSPGEKVPVGTPLATIRSIGEPAGAAPETPPAAAAPTPPAVPPQPAPAPHERRASPAARKAAEVLHVDIASVDGTGPGGAITREDVERAAARRREGREGREGRERQGGMRAAIGAAMSRSKREIPHLYLSTTVDMTRSLAWLSAENERRAVEERLLPIALLVKAVARAVRDVPEVNGFWRDGTFSPADGVHVGCAIALRDGGLVAPAIHDTDRKSLDEVMTGLTDLVARARGGALRSSELSDPTITVTNLGDLGVEMAFAIIYPPQVAIVAFGRVVQRAWVSDGRVEPRSVMTASVSVNHRVVDGRRAGQFLAALDRWLRTPEQI